MENEGGAQRQALIVQLESRRIIREVQCATLALAIDSPRSNARARQSSIQRLNQLKRGLEEIKASLQLLRGEPATDDEQQKSTGDSSD